VSWGVNFVGDADSIGAEFDSTRERCKAHGMPDAELENIHLARNLAVDLAKACGKLWITASGSWATIDPEPAKFDGLQFTARPAPEV
jgi:hypothetical protein